MIRPPVLRHSGLRAGTAGARARRRVPPVLWLGPAAGVLAALVVSGLVHELMFYPPGRTWCDRPPGGDGLLHAARRVHCGGGMVGEAPGVVAPATAGCHPINNFHTPQGAKLVKLQVKTLGKFFVMSFSWGFFEWFYTGGKYCGFSSFPTLGLEARKQKFQVLLRLLPSSPRDIVGYRHWIYTLLNTDCIMTGINALFFFFHVDIILDCYLFWTMELDLLDLEPVQILPQLLPME
ncbi:hypothetical protein ZWY2020_017670 [Hordeum vulgare]|nr:hypothetical protein ZWY2020_017670 [Hordeum vulgare]